MSLAHESDVEDVLNTLKALDAAHERQVKANGGPLPTLESAKLRAVAAWIDRAGWAQCRECQDIRDDLRDPATAREEC